jgi:cyclic dehypoxanthinyl futalosine synthase
MQGGMNDRLPIEWYEDLLRFISTNYPTIHIHAFSPPEFVEFERFFGMDVRQILRRFKAAGLRTIPGGGGEIFVPRVRRRIGSIKCNGDDWLRVMRVAHEEGISTSCTMMIGHIETVAERIEHMSMLRDMQDYALALGQGGRDGGTDGRLAPSDVERGDEETACPERGREERRRDRETERRRVEKPAVTIERVRTRLPGVFAKSPFDTSSLRDSVSPSRPGRYLAFIHWPFQRENVPLGRAKEYDPDIHGDFDAMEHEDIRHGRVVRSAGATEYLRMLAIARLFFDNIDNLQSSWVTMGPKIGQLALFFGANDMGGAMMEENVVSAAGTTYRLEVREICRLIRDAGFVPAQRDQMYNVLKRHDGPDSPDLLPDPAPKLRNVRRVDDTFIGSAPGLDAFRTGRSDDGADRSERVALPILGEAS